MTTSVRKDVIIIGAGASGLFCAAQCGGRGRTVLVLDHAGRAASKVLISGGGRCNFTNLHAAPAHYHSRNPRFCTSALARFTPSDFLSIVEQQRIAYHEKEAGQLFCSRSSRDIAALLATQCRRAGVEQLLGCRVTGVGKDQLFSVATDRGMFRSASLIVATGGLSYGNLGASGFGHDVARQFGLAVAPPRPALVPFVFRDRDRKEFRGLAGVSFDAAVNCGPHRFRGGILFTHRGLSGPAALQASLYWATGQALVVDLLPGTGILAVMLAKRRSRMELRTLLAAHLPKRFVETWCRRMAASKPLDQTSDRELRETADLLHAWQVVPAGTEGYETAEVTAGGVDTDELSSKTMEARKVPGLYFIGEVVDVTGQLGGYNLHWAWASGYAAGQFA